MLADILLDAIIDSLKLLPFLLLIYLLLEWLEHRASAAAADRLARAGRYGPLISAVLGCVPQCGFSVAAVKLWQAGLISLGALMAALLSTSDEALPVLLSHGDCWPLIWKLLLAKLVVAAAAGYGIDLLHRERQPAPPAEHRHSDVCHCHCRGGVLKPALRHTGGTLLFIFLVTLALNAAIAGLGEQRLSAFLLAGTFAQPFLSALIGFIPNCAASVLLAELYVSGGLSFGGALAGLGTGAGLGMMLLYRSRNVRQTALVCGLLYAISVAAGLLANALGL